MELTSSSHRNLAGNLALVSFAIGEIFVTLFAYVSYDWLQIKWLTSGFYALLIVYVYFIPQSPYWLYSTRKFDQLEDVLGRIAKTNGHSENEWIPDYKNLMRHPINNTKNTKIPIKDYISHFGPRLCITALIGFVLLLLYIKLAYGLALMNSVISPHLNVILGAIVEGVGYLSGSFVIMTSLGRKYSLVLYALLTSTCILTIPFITDRYPIMTVCVSQLGKLTISGALSVSWIYVPELFPTSTRGLSNGILVLFGRFGAILAPIIDAKVGDQYIQITSFVYAALTLAVVITVGFLPETRKLPFED